MKTAAVWCARKGHLHDGAHDAPVWMPPRIGLSDQLGEHSRVYRLERRRSMLVANWYYRQAKIALARPLAPGNKSFE